MLVYEVKSLPDLSLSKYQVFADSGIDGMLEAQTQFIKQLHRVLMLGEVNAHFLYQYSPKRKAGNKLKIYLIFSGKNDESTENVKLTKKSDLTYFSKLKQIIAATGISNYFNLQLVHEVIGIGDVSFKYMSVLHKKERILQAVIDNEAKEFYVVPNWEMNEDARLYNMIQLLQSFDAECCYRVDLYAVTDLEEQIHQSFEKPLLFLRNIGYKDIKISTLGQNQRDKRDPNSDEALHQYEQWIKNVDASTVFRCRISALSDDKQISQLILNSTIAECIQQGSAVTKTATGQFNCMSFIEELPDGLHLPDTPKSLSNWTTTFTSEELASFCRLPVLYDGENIELPKETAAMQEDEGIVLGKDTKGYDVAIPQKLLPKHMFVCGVPGSGKTNTMLHIANSLWNSEIIDADGNVHPLHIPFLVLEPAKREYRELALFDIPELLIFSPSACTNFPICINPFEFPIGLTLSEHIGKLCQVFEGAFPIAPPAPFILDRSIQAIYENKGWNYRDVNTGTKSYPIMQDLYDQFEKELLTTNYDSEIQGNIRSVLEMRIGSLLRREMKDIFNAEKSTLSPEEWLTKPVIVELEALGEGPANFVTLLLCTLIRETLKADPLKDKEKPVRHIIFIEEAHNLIAPESQVQDGMDSNPKVAATAFIVKMLAEVRALREGIIIADQLPTAMAPEVIKNTNIKLVHRLTSGDDRELVGSTMSASGLQMENMATYTSGQALFTYEKLLRPFEMQVCEVKQHGEETPNDERLYYLMSQKSGFQMLNKRIQDNKYNSIVEKIVSITEEERNKTAQLFDLNGIHFERIIRARFTKFIDDCTNVLMSFKHQKSILIQEIDELNVKYIGENDKAELQSIVMEIGNGFESAMKNFQKMYELQTGGN
jgi:DNA polymerase III delta prime subunit